MTTAGPVALLGGHEHRRGSEAIERTLLEQVGVTAPQVTVLPVASAARQRGMAAALARTYWTNLGASVRIAVPDANGSRHALDAIADADVIVLTGGVPNRLVAALGASPVWDAILERWRQGAGLAGVGRSDEPVRMAHAAVSPEPAGPHPRAWPVRRLRDRAALQPLSGRALGCVAQPPVRRPRRPRA
jgi:cyanophycinase-like exopeptidase